METLNKYLQNLEEIKTHNKTSLGLIAKYLLTNLELPEKLTSANQIAKATAVSNAMISRFCQLMGFKNIHEILFLQELLKKLNKNDKQNNNSDSNVEKASNLIENARKVFFLGVSNGFLINQDFARKINRLDKWTYVSDNKYESVGNARLLIGKDVLIVTSVSLQHQWMHEIISNTCAKVILLSSTMPKNLSKKVTIFFHLISNTSDTIHRNITYEQRTNAFKVFDKIFQELMRGKHNQLLLQATRYNKN